MARTTVETEEPPPPPERGERGEQGRRDESARGSARQILSHGTRVGRYVILNIIGRGGMGVVYAAHDPQLDRQVALKLIRAEDSREEAERLVREAQALAKLDDPHVVAVYDAGEVDGQVFVAMQLVDGENLEAALHKRRRSEDVAQVLAWFRDAGRGLAAAHAARLVHRDFKPSNVLIDRRGRVAVTDFGIAREQGRTHDPERRALSSADKLIGTPAYMAPEQHAMDRATEASDQFSFCVSLWEALFEQHPFVADRAATSSVEIGIAIFEGKLLAPRNKSRVPRRVVDALERGLQRDPGARWPSMTALLAELEPAARRARWPYAAAGGAAVAVALAGGAVFAWPMLHGAAGGDCGGDARLDAAWPASARAAIAARIRGSGHGYGDQVAETLLARLDGDVAQLRAAEREVCTARDEHADRPFVAWRSACLDARTGELAAFASSLAAGSGDALADYAIDASRLLAPVSSCNLHAVAAPPEPAIADAGASLDARIGHAIASLANGAWPDAERELGEVAAAAVTGELFERAARARYLRAAIELGFDEPARDDLQAAAQLADAHGLDAIAAQAWLGMLAVVKPEELEMTYSVAAAKAQRLNEPRLGDLVRLAYALALARVGKQEQAHRDCLDLATEIEALDDPWLRHGAAQCEGMTSTEPLARVADGDVDAMERLLGKGHPGTADSLRLRGYTDMLASSQLLAGSQAVLVRDRAARELETAIELYQRVYPRGHYAIAVAHDLRGMVERAGGHIAEANADFMAAATQIEKRRDVYALTAATIDYHVAVTAPPDQALAWIRAAAQLSDRGDVMSEYASIAADAGQWDEAFLVAKRDLVRGDVVLSTAQTAHVQWALARAIAGQHGDAAEARRLAHTARAALADANDTATVAAIDAWLALHRQAAVDVDGAAVEVVALEDELHGEPDVLGQADAADRDRRDQRVARLLVHALRHRRLDHARRDGADADAERRELARPRHGVRGERGLRRRVVRLAAVAVARDRRHVDDDAGLLLGRRPSSRRRRAP